MATTDEILAEAMVAETGAAVLSIDLDTRSITIPNTIKNLGVEFDDDVTRVYFQIPRHYGEFDLSEFVVRVNYVNANEEGDVYMPDDVVSDDDHISFSWLVGRHAAAYKGNVVFNVCLKKIDDSGVVLQEFNTTIATLPILGGLETSEAILAENYDILDQLLREADRRIGELGFTQVTLASSDFMNGHLDSPEGYENSTKWIVTQRFIPISVGDRIIINPNGKYVRVRISTNNSFQTCFAGVVLTQNVNGTTETEIISKYDGYVYFQVGGERLLDDTITPDMYNCDISVCVGSYGVIKRKIDEYERGIKTEQDILHERITSIDGRRFLSSADFVGGKSSNGTGIVLESGWITTKNGTPICKGDKIYVIPNGHPSVWVQIMSGSDLLQHSTTILGLFHIDKPTEFVCEHDGYVFLNIQSNSFETYYPELYNAIIAIGKNKYDSLEAKIADAESKYDVLDEKINTQQKYLVVGDGIECGVGVGAIIIELYSTIHREESIILQEEDFEPFGNNSLYRYPLTGYNKIRVSGEAGTEYYVTVNGMETLNYDEFDIFADSGDVCVCHTEGLFGGTPASDSDIGDIEAALNTIIEIQNSLIGGGYTANIYMALERGTGMRWPASDEDWDNFNFDYGIKVTKADGTTQYLTSADFLEDPEPGISPSYGTNLYPATVENVVSVEFRGNGYFPEVSRYNAETDNFDSCGEYVDITQDGERIAVYFG